MARGDKGRGAVGYRLPNLARRIEDRVIRIEADVNPLNTIPRQNTATRESRPKLPRLDGATSSGFVSFVHCTDFIGNARANYARRETRRQNRCARLIESCTLAEAAERAINRWPILSRAVSPRPRATFHSSLRKPAPSRLGSVNCPAEGGRRLGRVH